VNSTIPKQPVRLTRACYALDHDTIDPWLLLTTKSQRLLGLLSGLQPVIFRLKCRMFWFSAFGPFYWVIGRMNEVKVGRLVRPLCVRAFFQISPTTENEKEANSKSCKIQDYETGRRSRELARQTSQ
jgi:hypothetical protein